MASYECDPPLFAEPGALEKVAETRATGSSPGWGPIAVDARSPDRLGRRITVLRIITATGYWAHRTARPDERKPHDRYGLIAGLDAVSRDRLRRLDYVHRICPANILE